MAVKNDTADDLSQHLGISRQALSLRINNHRKFKTNEIAMIRNRYKLSYEDVYKIFIEEDKNNAVVC